MHPGRGIRVHNFIHILSEGELKLLYIVVSGPVNIQFEVCMIHTGPEALEGCSVGIQ